MNMRLCVAVLFTLGAGVGATTMGCGGSKSGSGGSTGTTTATSTKAATGSTTGTATGTTGTSGNCDDNCRMQHMAGFNTLNQAVVQSCGCTMGAACATACMNDMVCTTKMGLPATGSMCDTCIQAEGAKGPSSTCSTNAAFGMKCQNDTDCKAFISCETACFG